VSRSTPIVRRALLLASCLAVAACSAQQLNTGVVDYRLASGDVGTADSATAAAYENHTFYARYFPPEALQRLDVVKPGDSVAIRILQAFICDFSEINRKERWRLFRDGSYAAEPCNPDGDAYVDTQGEIAVVADVVELDGEKIIEHGTGTSSADKGRLIYYNEDVRETGQFLNFSNLPIYGPVSYSGRPMYVRLFVLELDNEENAQFTSTLTKLASFGGTAYPPASPILSLLKELGSAFVSGNQDDLEFEYELAFDGFAGQATSYAPLAVGTYAFVRLEDRDMPLDWSTLTLNERTGRLQKGGKDYREGTYFTLKVTRNEPAFLHDRGQLFEQFREAASQRDDGPNLDGLAALATELGTRTKQRATFDEARTALGLLQASTPNAVEKAQAWETIATSICAATSASGADAATVLTTAEIEYLAAAIYELLPADSGHQSKLTLSAIRTACPQGPGELLRSIGQ
jgi:hypothetical protein